MKRELPTDEHVEAAITELLAQAATTGRRATLADVERQLGIPHATFYRNYPHLITRFRQRKTSDPGNATGRTAGGSDETIRRLRRENEDLRRTVHIYAESIRQLTLTNEELRAKLHEQAGVTSLRSRTAHQ